ncbi:Glycosyltransferase involved in cell wall bisynthesis [Mucilaginibacter mallensis]|uniref:Glycosyltransferase involved in cell wall bisynthesis n=1 Tax=Mucilaginibacter mallensis TaxID=652787 RepID=A0A1H1X9Y5_MUCMA|nr:hypothetical protein [Mucilaginibacter mallensis]SDT05506.1 Glycosyltransferase involved in cell wall bisynthesis [Mucilaginibacter mallensis]
MKITFICASLEPGRDGVGDYVRRLACEIIKQGHKAEAVALNDPYVALIKKDIQWLHTVGLSVFRLSSSLSMADRYKYLHNRLETFDPDMVSLQYVGFGFNKYGLPIDILLKLRKTLNKRRLHLMLHELWCGMAITAGQKEKILGETQKFFLKTMIKGLKPEAIFTSIEPYQSFLQNIGIKAIVVPIFGNVPANEECNENDWQHLVDETGLSSLVTNPQAWLTLGFFGTTYSCQGLDELLELAALAAKSGGLKLGVIFIGNNRDQHTLDLIKTMPNTTFWQTGALSTGKINRCMQLINIGVVTSPVDGINKSGSALAWMERGIPVLISKADKHYKEGAMAKQGIYQATSVNVILNAYKTKDELVPVNNLKKAAVAYTTCSL